MSNMMEELQGLVAEDMRDKAASASNKPEEGWWRMTVHSVQDVRADDRDTITIDGTEYPNPEHGDKIVNLRMNLWAYGGTKWSKAMDWKELSSPRCDFIRVNVVPRMKPDKPDKLCANSNRMAKLQKLSGKVDLQDIIQHFAETSLYGRWQTNSFDEERNVLMDMKV